jgi:predicted Zn-dependent protease
MRGTWLLVALSLTTAVSTTARADMFKPGVKDQIALGQKAAASVRKEMRVLPDSDPRVKVVRQIGNRLVSLIPKSERDKKPFQYTFDVIDSPEINAFALPGGPIFFYRGLLEHLQTEDQVAGVLGHELAHIRYEHWASAYANNQKRQLGLSVLLVLLNANSTAFDIASVSDQLLFTLPYSRSNESSADKSGYDLMVSARFNPQGMADVFRVLKEKGGSSKTAEWASSHPDADKRISNIEKRISASTVQYPAQTRLSRTVLSRSFITTKKTLPVMLSTFDRLKSRAVFSL